MKQINQTQPENMCKLIVGKYIIISIYKSKYLGNKSDIL